VDERIRKLNGAEARPAGGYVLYWCRVNHRVDVNHALTFAAARANRLGLPLLVFDGLGCDYPYANDRLHTFILEGAAEIGEALRRAGIGYCFHIARRKLGSESALRKVVQNAAAIVTDDYPEVLLRHLPPVATIARGAECYAVDSSCVVPFRQFPDPLYAAYSLRPRMQRLLPSFLKPIPQVRVERRFVGSTAEWHTEVTVQRVSDIVAACQIDHSVRPVPSFRGGAAEASRHLRRFLRSRLRRYAAAKNNPAAHTTSDLSPYLHHGHISSLHVALAARDYATQHQLVAEEFLEELLVRRELAFNFTASRSEFTLGALPDWARTTLQKHRRDKRKPIYTREQFEAAATADDLWNAAQSELLLRGKIHGYYRMYWGKKIIEWSPSPEEALDTMLHLNDRYCLDGQDPNAYANILWCFGLHDRPWSERPIFGTVRYMSRAGMERKTDVGAYLREIIRLTRR